MSVADGAAIVNHFHVVYTIWHEIVQEFIIGLGSEFKGPGTEIETMVVTGNEVDGSLALDFIV